MRAVVKKRAPRAVAADQGRVSTRDGAPHNHSTHATIVKLRALIERTHARMALKPSGRPRSIVPVCSFGCGAMLPLPDGWACPKCETREVAG